MKAIEHVDSFRSTERPAIDPTEQTHMSYGIAATTLCFTSQSRKMPSSVERYVPPLRLEDESPSPCAFVVVDRRSDEGRKIQDVKQDRGQAPCATALDLSNSPLDVESVRLAIDSPPNCTVFPKKTPRKSVPPIRRPRERGDHCSKIRYKSRRSVDSREPRKSTSSDGKTDID